MKTKVLLCFIAASALCFGQETTSIEGKIEKEKKISYSLINEYGFHIGMSFDNTSIGSTWGEITGVLVNGIRFNKTQNEIGIGIGFEYFFLSYGIPVFLNYRHYFPSETKYKPLINIALGPRFSSVSTRVGSSDFFIDRKVTGLYGTFAGGFRYKSLSFTAGICLRNWDIYKFAFLGGVEFKIGYTL